MVREPGKRFTNLPDWVRELVQHELASSLLARPYEWRERRVQTITPIDERHYRDRISLQLNVRADLFEDALRLVARRLRRRGGLPARQRWQNARALRSLRDTQWEGETVSLLIPLLVLPKQVLISPNLEDASSRRLTLQNRQANAIFSTRHLLKILHAAELEAQGGFSTARFGTLVRALMFCMPSGLVQSPNFEADALRGDIAADVEAIAAFFRMHGTTLDADGKTRIRNLLMRSWAIFVDAEPLLWHPPDHLRDPLINPLLLLPDRRKFSRPLEPAKDSVAWPHLFLDECEQYLAMIEALVGSRAAAEGAQPPPAEQPQVNSEADSDDVLMELSRFTHTWAALARLGVTFGQSLLVKLTTTGVLERESRPRLGATGLRHGYVTPVGDAQSTHIEVISPEPGVVRIDTGQTVVRVGDRPAVGPLEIRSIFGFEHSASRTLQAFYTTKTKADLVEASRRRDPGPSDSQGVAPQEDEVRVRVVYRMEPVVGAIYSLVTLAAAGAAVTAVARATGGGFQALGETEATLTGIIALLAGTLAIREGAIAARIVVFRRSILIASLCVLVVALIAAYALPEEEKGYVDDGLTRVWVTPAPTASPTSEPAESRPRPRNQRAGRESDDPSRDG